MVLFFIGDLVMATKPVFDQQAAHRHFSVVCFNRTWELIDKKDRTPAEDQEMIQSSLASLWHWTQREECTPTNLSIGYWQVSRAYISLGQVENARRYAGLCLEINRQGNVSAFYRGYAYEALARVEAATGNRARMEEYLAEAQRAAAAVPDPQERDQLLDDLDTIRMPAGTR